MGRSGMRMLRPGSWTARHSAAFARHHSCVHIETCRDLTSPRVNALKRAGHVLAGGDGPLGHAHVAPGQLHRYALCCIGTAPLLHVF